MWQMVLAAVLKDLQETDVLRKVDSSQLCILGIGDVGLLLLNRCI